MQVSLQSKEEQVVLVEIGGRITVANINDMDDPLGVGMRTLSPVEQWVKERYREN